MPALQDGGFIDFSGFGIQCANTNSNVGTSITTPPSAFNFHLAHKIAKTTKTKTVKDISGYLKAKIVQCAIPEPIMGPAATTIKEMYKFFIRINRD